MIDTSVSIVTSIRADFLTDVFVEYQLDVVIDGIEYSYSFSSMHDLEKFRSELIMEDFFKWLRKQEEFARIHAKKSTIDENEAEKVRNYFHDRVEEKFQELYEVLYPPGSPGPTM